MGNGRGASWTASWIIMLFSLVRHLAYWPSE